MLSAVLLGFAAAPILVRFGAADITPSEPLPLGGYTARKGAAGEVGDERLWARCLMLQQGDNPPVFIVAADMLTSPESLVAAVKEKMPAGNLLLGATHTHSAPDSQMLNKRMNFAIPGIATFSQRWLDWYSDKIASACSDAASSTPIHAEELAYRVADIAANRGRREGAKANPTTFRLESAQGRSLLAVYGAHATIFEEDSKKISGDWPGAWASALDCPVLVGAMGDVSPASDEGSPAERIKAMVEKLQNGLGGAPVRKLAGDNFSLRFAREAIELGDVKPHPAFAESFGAPEPIANLVVKRFAPESAEVTALAIGEVVVVGIPGELSSALGRDIQKAGAAAGFAQTVVVSHANGWIGYILDPEDYDRGGYEATLSFHGREIGLRVVQAAQKAVSALRTGNPGDSKVDSSRRKRPSEAA